MLLREPDSLFDLEHMNEVFTAQRLADHFGVKRNTVSHYLNQLNDEQLLVKINSRPVIYFTKKLLKNNFLSYARIFIFLSMISKRNSLFSRNQKTYSLL